MLLCDIFSDLIKHNILKFIDISLAGSSYAPVEDDGD